MSNGALSKNVFWAVTVMMGENGFRVDAGDAIRKGGTEFVGLICGWA